MTGPEETQEVRREGTSTSAWSSAKNTTVLESAVFAQLKTGLRTATESCVVQSVRLVDGDIRNLRGKGKGGEGGRERSVLCS